MKLETVLCIEEKILASHISKTGFVPIDEVDSHAFLAPQNLWFAPRDIADFREDFRQLIPYVILRVQDQIALYARTKKGGEKRLHGYQSVGFGGHIALDDVVLSNNVIDVSSTLIQSANREIEEEVIHAPLIDRGVIGLIYDNSDKVSRFHLGIVELWTLESPLVEAAHQTISECRFAPLSILQAELDSLEGWSRLCATSLFSKGIDYLSIKSVENCCFSG